MFISISHGIKLLCRINTFPSYFTLTLFISFVKEGRMSSLKFIFQNFLVYLLINIVDKQDCKPSTTYIKFHLLSIYSSLYLYVILFIYIISY